MENKALEKAVRPLYNICEDKKRVVLKLEMPGVLKDDLVINIEDNELRINGKRKEEEETGKYLVRERERGDYYHAFTVDNTVDREKIDASFENGILTLSLGLKESAQPRKITIKT